MATCSHVVHFREAGCDSKDRAEQVYKPNTSAMFCYACMAMFSALLSQQQGHLTQLSCLIIGLQVATIQNIRVVLPP